MTGGQIGEQVEGLTQGIAQVWAFQLQVRKHESDHLAFFVDCRTLKKIGAARGQGYQLAEGQFKLFVACMVLFEQAVYVLLPVGDLGEFFVIGVLGNTLVYQELHDAVLLARDVLALAMQGPDSVVMVDFLGLMGLAQVAHDGVQHIRWNLNCAENIPDLFDDSLFLDPEFFLGVSGVAADQVGVFALLEVATDRPARGGAAQEPTQQERGLGLGDGFGAASPLTHSLAGVEERLVD